MQSVGANSPLGSEFDNFLFAPLGEDENGLPLSVISLLARMNLDPWQEAGDLAALPADAAARRLAFSLNTLTDPVLRRAITETMVLRLLALLPRQVPVAVQAPAPAGIPAAPHAGARIGTIIVITSAIILLVSRIFGAHGYPSLQSEVVHSPAVLPVPSQAMPTNPGHKD
jgi:hypothetical protein